MPQPTCPRSTPTGAFASRRAPHACTVMQVCIDFTSRLLPGEGVLVGSCCHSLILVHAETLPSYYAPPRPFRCNAGPVHAYCQLENGLTKYLCEIEAGDRVVVADQSGRTRALTVGRLKIEPREVCSYADHAHALVKRICLSTTQR